MVETVCTSVAKGEGVSIKREGDSWFYRHDWAGSWIQFDSAQMSSTFFGESSGEVLKLVMSILREKKA